MEKQKSTWGGAREGAGRPAGSSTVPICVRISREAAGKLDTIKNKSQYINDLILRD